MSFELLDDDRSKYAHKDQQGKMAFNVRIPLHNPETQDHRREEYSNGTKMLVRKK
jgi:hypothetical protein